MKESDIRPQDLFNTYLALAQKDNEVFFADRSGFQAVACPACGSRDYSPGLEKQGFHYLSCAECDSLYLSPRPTPDLYADYYRDAESVRFWSEHFYKRTADARREKIYRPRAQLVGQWVQKRPGRPGDDRVFMDVGAGYGIFLEEIRRLDLFERIVGIEPAPELAAICRERGFEVIEEYAESARLPQGQADFLTAFEVLEHVPDPLAFLRSLKRILRPGGIGMLTTLTVSGFDIQVLWERSKSVYPPHHINLLSTAGMRKLIDRSGLKLLELATPGELDLDIVANMKRENPKIQLSRFVETLIGATAGVRNNFQQFLKDNELSSHVRVMVTL